MPGWSRTCCPSRSAAASSSRSATSSTDVVCNLVAFACAAGASVLLHHWLPAGLSLVAVTCWLVLARRTQLSLRDRHATQA